MSRFYQLFININLQNALTASRILKKYASLHK